VSVLKDLKNGEKFFKKRNFFIFLIILNISVIANIVYYSLNMPKINEKEVVWYRNQLNYLKNKKETLLLKGSKIRKRFMQYKTYLFSDNDISQIENFLNTFNGVLKELGVVNCGLQGYLNIPNDYINVKTFEIRCTNFIDAKKYKLLFDYLIIKNHILNVKSVQATGDGYVFIKIYKKIGNENGK